MQNYDNESQLLVESLKPLFSSLNQFNKNLPLPNTLTLPAIVPHLDASLFKHRQSFQLLSQVAQDSYQDLAQQRAQFFSPENIQVFQQNAHSVTSRLEFDNDLLDLFKTEYHIRLLWGNGKLAKLQPPLSEERHSQFKKVLNTLTNMCYQ